MAIDSILGRDSNSSYSAATSWSFGAAEEAISTNSDFSISGFASPASTPGVLTSGQRNDVAIPPRPPAHSNRRFAIGDPQTRLAEVWRYLAEDMGKMGRGD